jgi:S-adenosylmethionine:tRNA ribosyltransferase-isomerase
MNNHINIADYNYPLTEEKIALFPCKNRDESKLLVYKDNAISEDIFKNIPQYLTDNHLLVFNNTRVIQARILFAKPTGSVVEIFCLEPLSPTTLHSLIFQTKQSCEWECFVGNNKRFTQALSIDFQCDGQAGVLQAEKIDKHTANSFRIRFSWTPSDLSFAEVLESVGKIPLPPYIKRTTELTDTERYQTIYTQEKGSVAAPTARLHFTPELMTEIKTKNISTAYITLHVGAGTFKPVTETYAENHVMHEEQLFFTKETIHNLLKNSDKKIVAVGTTTARSLESLYWIGVKLAPPQPSLSFLHLSQWEVYEKLIPKQLTVEQSLNMILKYLEDNDLDVLHASTALMITPDYQPKMVKGIVTNFHQPQSTLLLLISSFVGGKWKDIYDYALAHDFRFLSYGDACLFL